jgi:hypothetical protein
MLPPIDLNLMKVKVHRGNRVLLAKSEAAWLLKLRKTKSDALALCRHYFQSIWNSQKKCTAGGTISSPY